jgi:hypothetical protein
MSVTRQGGKGWGATARPKAAGGLIAALSIRNETLSGNDLAAHPGRTPYLSGDHSPRPAGILSHGKQKIYHGGIHRCFPGIWRAKNISAAAGLSPVPRWCTTGHGQEGAE